MSRPQDFTPGPWAQGRTLKTARTAKWKPETIAENDAYESLHVFANFSPADEGRGRILVAKCDRAEDARLIAQAPALVAALDRLARAAEHRDNTMGDPMRLIECRAELAEAAREARAVLAAVAAPKGAEK